MCGIAGIIDFKKIHSDNDLSSVINLMISTLEHRGPDSGGVWVDQKSGVGLGHRRLSIIDLSQDGQQPMISACSRYVIVFNGEIYNFPAIRKSLEGKGHSFHGHSDTEVLLEAISAWGVKEALETCNGMFAFAVWDRHKRELYMARDRMGKKPLYYGWVGTTLLFGSELKSLRAYPDWQADFDQGALSLFFRHNYIPSPYSIHSNIRKLKSGTYVRFSLSDPPGTFPEPSVYWSLTDVVISAKKNLFPPDQKFIIEIVDRQLHEAVQRRMISDVPLGALLSGGIDSSLIVAIMGHYSTHPVKTFCIGFDDPQFNEAKHAKEVAGYLGTDHVELYVSEQDAINMIPRIPELYDEPFADLSQIPTFIVSQLARESVTVALSGDGGDELFAGYPRYFESSMIIKVMESLPFFIQQGIGDMLVSSSKILGRLTCQQSRRFVRMGELFRAEKPDKYRQLLSAVIRSSELVNAVNEPETPMTDTSIQNLGLCFTETLMLMDQMAFLQEDILAKVDRSSMAVSLEVRAPILDYLMVELAWRIPLSMKIKAHSGKQVLKQLLYKYIPQELVERPKRGFSVPIDNWLRGSLQDWADDIMYSDWGAKQQYLNTSKIRRLWEAHKTGEVNAGQILWNALMFLNCNG